MRTPKTLGLIAALVLGFALCGCATRLPLGPDGKYGYIKASVGYEPNYGSILGYLHQEKPSSK